MGLNLDVSEAPPMQIFDFPGPKCRSCLLNHVSNPSSVFVMMSQRTENDSIMSDYGTPDIESQSTDTSTARSTLSHVLANRKTIVDRIKETKAIPLETLPQTVTDLPKIRDSLYQYILEAWLYTKSKRKRAL